MITRFLLVQGTTDNYWRKFLEEALAPLGELHAVNMSQFISRVTEIGYDLVIVDATSVPDVEFHVSQLRAKQKDCRIVVMTASPTWQRARAAFEAGAIDYIPRTLDKADLLDIFRQTLQKPLPDWPR